MSHFRLLVLSSLVLAGCAAGGASQPPPKSTSVSGTGYDSVSEAVKNSSPDDIVCTHDKKVGSHMKKSSCMTVRQREEQAKRSQEAVERRQRSGASDGINDNR